MSDSELRDQKVFLQSFPLQLSKKKKEKTTEQVRTIQYYGRTKLTNAKVGQTGSEQSSGGIHPSTTLACQCTQQTLACIRDLLSLPADSTFILTSLSSPRSLSVALARFLALCCNLLCCAVLCCAVLCCAVTVRCGGVCRHAGDR
jgi:hypothetical protein